MIEKEQYKKNIASVALKKQQGLSFLKNEMHNIKLFIDKILAASLESSTAKIERDYKIHSL